MSDNTHVPVAVIESFMLAVFEGLGVPPADACVSTNVLLAADLRGVKSHGISRLKYYYDRIAAGVQSTQTNVRVVQESETTALLDGQHGMGHVIAASAMRLAIEKARRYGLGAVAVRNSTHFGIAGYYSLMAAAQGMLGLTVTNARPAIAPTFSSEPMLGTNPIAFAAPSDLPYPFCFDAATSIIQRGTVEVAARTADAMAEGLVIDAGGQPLTDPQAILAGLDTATAALLPLGGAGETTGGYKGYGLATMVEILSAALSGGVFMKGLLGYNEDGSRRPYMLGHFFLAVDVAHFVPLETFRAISGGIMRALQNAQVAPGQERIYVAGEKEYEMEQRVRAEGIAVNARLREELRFLKRELQIEGYDAWF